MLPPMGIHLITIRYRFFANLVPYVSFEIIFLDFIY